MGGAGMAPCLVSAHPHLCSGRVPSHPASPRSGSMTLRQIHFASVDLELHARFTPGKVRRCAWLWG